MPRAAATIVPVLAVLLLSGCGGLQRLAEIGSRPAMTPSTDPTKDPDWRPITMPTPRTEPAMATANSLWRPGSRAFFKDQRAAQVGDIVTVVVKVVDSAVVKNGTQATRTGNQALGVPDLFGLQSSISRALPKGVDLTKLLSTDSASSAVGNGTIARGETIQIRLGGVITQVLPNGNLAVSGRQEVRINSELRELHLSGVIRPQDILSDNTVLHDRMAEARISYGGRGQLTDVQTPRYGQQILDVISPF
ncbi:MAG: flagellar basal body L-ring protein FlgH [Gemmatimonadaceae bacterium]|nr:flagellar basal body L-ring protein FlgH [Acetobacteraceae bacterium]